MSKIPNAIVAEIRKLASVLPVNVQGVPEYESFSKDGKTYRRRTGKLLEAGNINHERRMKKAYYKGGVVGYLLYFDSYLKPGPLKLQVWENIAKISGKTLSDELIATVSTPEEVTPVDVPTEEPTPEPQTVES
jgi:hypothetical protein